MANMSERGQMMILFSLVVASIIVTLSVLYAQNMIAGIETSKTMFAYPKEEIRNLEEIKTSICSNPDINEQIKVFCAEKGYVCSVENDGGKCYVKFISKEVYYEGEKS